MQRLLIFIALALLGGPLLVCCVSPAAGDAPDAALAAPWCGDGVCGVQEAEGACAADCAATGQVDLLFVVDNSASMEREQELLRAQFGVLVDVLRGAGVAGVPDLHVGVVSTDVGAGPYGIAFCERPTGDDGDLLATGCAQTDFAPYLIDAPPQGCSVDQRSDGSCAAYHCGVSACAEGQVVTDPATGCPRCRNFMGETLDSVFGCMAEVGTSGCGFEQPLESMRRALDANPANHGFLRPGSVLVVLFVTDEDDCSARPGAQIFNPADSALGPLTGYRCFEQGVVCDVNDPLVVGPRQDCRLREEETSLLVPVSEYVSFLRQLRDPGRLIVAAVAGPWDGASATVTRDGDGQPMVQPVCDVEGGSPVGPGFRLSSFVRQLHPTSVEQPSADWAYRSVCEIESFDLVLAGVGARIAAVLR